MQQIFHKNSLLNIFIINLLSLFVGTKSELEAMVAKKRMNIPPSQHLLSASDSFSTDTENSPKSAKVR